MVTDIRNSLVSGRISSQHQNDKRSSKSMEYGGRSLQDSRTSIQSAWLLLTLCITYCSVQAFHNSYSSHSISWQPFPIGVVKTQWYNCWIQRGALRATTDTGTKHELAMVHSYLETVSLLSLMYWYWYILWSLRSPCGLVGSLPVSGSPPEDPYQQMSISCW